jgi:predicted amidohydrolase YtcJ
MLTLPYDRLVVLMRRAIAHGIETAIHAIGDHANQLVLDAFEATGARGSVEHAQLVSAADFARFARLGVVASIQPEHLVDDRDVADHFWPGRTGRAFAYDSLRRAGAELALGSDAPVAPLDPWITMASAVHRTKDGREPWHPEQSIPYAAALTASTRGRPRVRAWDPADLVIVDRDPATASADELRTMPVCGTLLGGRWTWRDNALSA